MESWILVRRPAPIWCTVKNRNILGIGWSQTEASWCRRKTGRRASSSGRGSTKTRRAKTKIPTGNGTKTERRTESYSRKETWLRSQRKLFKNILASFFQFSFSPRILTRDGGRVYFEYEKSSRKNKFCYENEAIIVKKPMKPWNALIVHS